MALTFLFNAYDIANRYGFKEKEAESLFNLGCYYSVINELEKSREKIMMGIELNPILKEKVVSDPKLENLRTKYPEFISK